MKVSLWKRMAARRPSPRAIFAKLKAGASKRWLAVALVVVTIGAALAAVLIATAAETTEDMTEVYVIQRGDVVASIDPTGEVYAPRQAELSFDVSKIELVELLVAPGQQVRAGDILARIDPTTLERRSSRRRLTLRWPRTTSNRPRIPTPISTSPRHASPLQTPGCRLKTHEKRWKTRARPMLRWTW